MANMRFFRTFATDYRTGNQNTAIMKTARRMLLLAAALCTASFLMAQSLYDASGVRTIAKIYNNTIYDASGVRTIGKIYGERIMDGSGARTINYVRSDGRVMDCNGSSSVGQINSNGRITDGGSRTLGYVENGRVFDSSHVRTVGYYRDVDVKYVAYYFFFFPNRDNH